MPPSKDANSILWLQKIITKTGQSGQYPIGLSFRLNLAAHFMAAIVCKDQVSYA